MIDQLDLLAQVREARDDGINRADVHANPGWKDLARDALLWCVDHHPTFTADQVWERLENTGTDVSTHNPSALGPVFLAAARAGLIEKTGKMRLTINPRRHRDLTEWRRTRTVA